MKDLVREAVDQLTARRKVLRLSQAEVGRRMSRSQDLISNIEKHKHVANVATLDRYARAVGCTLKLNIEISDLPGNPS